MPATIWSRIFCHPIRYPKNVKIKIHRTITLHIVLYGCKTWSLTRREEHKLRVFEIGVLRMIYGPKRAT